MFKKLFQRGIRQYEILSQLSEGGMSTIYRARCRLTGETVALKVLFAEHSARRDGFDKLFSEKQVEGDIASSFNHPNVVKTYSYGRAKNKYFFAMEYVRAPHLKHAVYQSPFLVKGKELKIISQTADAIAYIHSRGVIHRDICSKNILVDDNGKVKLIDFGLAFAKSGSHRSAGERSGTPSYMAPEQVLALNTDERTDIFSFGIVMYEILSGNMPFPGSDKYSRMHNRINFNPVDIKSRVPGIDPRLAVIVNKSIQKDPCDRYQSMENLIYDLGKCVRGQD